MENVALSPIGIIHSPFKTLENMPIQPPGAGEIQGRVRIFPAYVEGLQDLDGFSHIYLIYAFHRAERTEMRVIPYMDSKARGVFATRSPLRPSHLGLSIVELLSVEGGELHVRGIDVLDGTPLLDIKPYIPAFDHREKVRSGWMQQNREAVVAMRSDDRFV
ncbi:tRNA (N6-threonylcarbamoyladenosine(37)-N6)-methyltransferase TrmO [Desulfobotulus sp.]|uniref:tRNA (N6-threonylcarbamoyladenosine(37)-N6)-methyltransferase TrmO n=1 Tax=Desulfobotulus sp. TaxID=1940337 RepID=UPI002A362F9F|nr:tRNA (N6-threonylcarbamoyladenosine(37)-N6)-methyltransferase TrmO [Desulfobotulus sp.]MDY0163913.1 tRNA (N6-threonylcarbamoyladenosine(37)-N6)-methyltransferase TrmO [Desulfobotulus sp.]